MIGNLIGNSTWVKIVELPGYILGEVISNLRAIATLLKAKLMLRNFTKVLLLATIFYDL
ncbi:MAG: hypothetical protein F6K35_46655 [Okeania sp. SIO2H7]|nr:hypothetical protein [Okeania sp. SIO2H7]